MPATTFSFSALLPIIALFAATTVRGHGYVGKIIADGSTYDGPAPVDQAGTLSIKTPIRQIASEEPVTDVNSKMIACGSSTSVPASEIAKVTSGSTLKVQWFDGSGMPTWPHDNGPLMTYMAPCSSSNCNDDPNKLSFFKIQQDGQVPGDRTKWVQAEIMNGTPYSITVPPGVPNGAYVMRHEIISLQNAASGGAESYPSCFQVEVTGSKSTSSPSAFVASLPSGSTIQLPGGYNKNDPGWKVDVYTNPENLDYSKMFPGPPISNAVSKPGSGNNSMVTTQTTSPVHTPTKTPRSASLNRNTTLPTNSPSTSVITTSSPIVMTTTITQTFVLTMTLDDAGPPLGTTSDPRSQLTPTATTFTSATTTILPRRNIPGSAGRPYTNLVAEKRHAHRRVSFPQHHH